MLYKKKIENVLLPSQKQNTLQNVGIKTVITLLVFNRCYIYLTTFAHAVTHLSLMEHST